MNGKFKELLMKKAKEGKTISADDAKQKMTVLDQLSSMMGGEMADKMKGMKKVSVMAKDDEGLKAGLEKAEEVIDDSEDDKEDEKEEKEEKDYSSYSKEELIEMLAESK